VKKKPFLSQIVEKGARRFFDAGTPPGGGKRKRQGGGDPMRF